jgi:DNA-binding GntR family transcriptional regulator
VPKSRAIVRQSLPDAIASDIRERILSGELEEGETIRQEALAADYNVSRMPIREALKRLDAEGLVQFTTNRGASVTKHSLQEIGEIFDLRTLIEVDLFRRAIPKMTEVHFKECENILKEMEMSYDVNDVGKWGSLNFQYHSALYAAAGRNLTNEILQRINLQSDRYVRMHLSVLKQQDLAKKEHRQLLEFARAGEVGQACELLSHHIERTKMRLLDLIAARRST